MWSVYHYISAGCVQQNTEPYINTDPRLVRLPCSLAGSQILPHYTDDLLTSRVRVLPAHVFQHVILSSLLRELLLCSSTFGSYLLLLVTGNCDTM